MQVEGCVCGGASDFYQPVVRLDVRSSRPDSIGVQSRGGLGNQMFLFALGMQLSSSFECPLVLDSAWHARHADRPFELNSFRLPATTSVVERSYAWDLAQRLLARFPVTLQPALERITGVINERSAYFDPRILAYGPGYTFRGYFQSWKYFEDVGAQVKEVLTSLVMPSNWFITMNEVLSGLGSWIGVHIRRGDYTTPTAMRHHGLVGSSYYEQAIALVHQEYGPLPVIAFSDDVRLAKLVMPTLHSPITWIDSSLGGSSAEHLQLLAKATHLVTANSSFSWWSAWLGDHSGRMVIAPTPWFVSNAVGSADLLPSHWCSLPHV
jgi:hypothetical protein